MSKIWKLKSVFSFSKFRIFQRSYCLKHCWKPFLNFELITNYSVSKTFIKNTAEFRFIKNTLLIQLERNESFKGARNKKMSFGGPDVEENSLKFCVWAFALFSSLAIYRVFFGIWALALLIHYAVRRITISSNFHKIARGVEQGAVFMRCTLAHESINNLGDVISQNMNDWNAWIPSRLN